MNERSSETYGCCAAEASGRRFNIAVDSSSFAVASGHAIAVIFDSSEIDRSLLEICAVGFVKFK